MSSLERLERFTPLPRALGQTNKTGLGSSAALVTSLVAALLLHLGLADLAGGRDTVHALAQAAHCAAQGKVGSGFDVASAVYGTHVYRRFSPAVLEPMFAGSAPLLDIVAGEWDQETRPFRLPRGLRLMLADVDAGTDTPSFVGQVLKWRKDRADEALRMWTVQDAANAALETALRGLAALEDEPGYTEALQAAVGSEVANVSRPPRTSTDAQLDDFSPINAQLKQIQGAIEGVRKGMRDMSAASGVPIEPQEQTRLLDECLRLPGVLGGGVPGGESSPRSGPVCPVPRDARWGEHRAPARPLWVSPLTDSRRIRRRLAPRHRRRVDARGRRARVGRLDRDERLPARGAAERRRPPARAAARARRGAREEAVRRVAGAQRRVRSRAVRLFGIVWDLCMSVNWHLREPLRLSRILGFAAHVGEPGRSLHQTPVDRWRWAARSGHPAGPRSGPVTGRSTPAWVPIGAWSAGAL